MDEKYSESPRPWWFEHTKSPRAARLIEMAYEPGAGMMDFGVMKAKPQNQVRNIKKALHKLGYRFRWRLVDGHIMGWALREFDWAPKPPGAGKLKKPAP